KWSDPIVADDGREQVMSSRHAGAGFAPLSIDSLRGTLAGARGLSVASAYYDVEFFRNLLLADGKPGDHLDQIRIVVNGLAGPRLNMQRDELGALQTDLQSLYEDVEIRLAFATSIFHPKLYLIRNHGSRVALIGSANATTAAMSVNDEILLRLEGSVAGLEAYFEHIWTHEAHALATQVGRIRNLVQFFRTGRLFFKASTAFQMTINPFGELLRRLPRADRARLTNVRLRNSEPKPGVGPFDLVAAIGLGEDEEDAATRQEDDKHRASIKPYSVETCYGYWVPQSLTASLELDLDQAELSKSARYGRIAAALAETPDAPIRKMYAEYVDDAKRLFSDLPSVPSVLAELRADPFASHEWFMTRLQQLREKLGQEGYVQRLCRPFTDVAVPEIWDDPVARGDFEESFFEYLSYVSTLPTKSRVPRQIIEWAKCSSDADAATIQEALVERLHEVGWNDPDDWKVRSRASASDEQDDD
ncbi:MAG: hypothetical protein H6708_02740, partial [Kofleriaceae bacterium]|nr:hypothetical protein [Kofleriaceae bacterium]